MKLVPVILCLLAAPAAADPPRILDVSATGAGSDRRISVTLAHPDTGWDHYADGWRVLAADGTELGLRVLHHPHVEEQPFTRSLSLSLPSGTTRVLIEARCSVDGWSGETVALDLPD